MFLSCFFHQTGRPEINDLLSAFSPPIERRDSPLLSKEGATGPKAGSGGALFPSHSDGLCFFPCLARVSREEAGLFGAAGRPGVLTQSSLQLKGCHGYTMRSLYALAWKRRRDAFHFAAAAAAH